MKGKERKKTLKTYFGLINIMVAWQAASSREEKSTDIIKTTTAATTATTTVKRE